MKLSKFIKRTGLSMTVKPAKENKNWSGSQQANHYSCVLKGKDKSRMTITFSQGLGITGEPKLENVLNCLASDAAGLESCADVSDWIGQYGYDIKEGRKIYKAGEKQTDKLRKFLDPDDFQTLLWNVQLD